VGHLSVLRRIETLEQINFHFQTVKATPHPDGYLCSCDPWIRVRQEIWTKVSCQKDFVDMFLLFAFDGIRHIPKITLSGHVKNSTKENWDRIFQREKRGYHWETAVMIAWWLCRPVEYL